MCAACLSVEEWAAWKGEALSGGVTLYSTPCLDANSYWQPDPERPGQFKHATYCSTAPKNLAVTSTGVDSIGLYWTYSSLDPIAEYEISFRDPAASNPVVWKVRTGSASTSYLLTGTTDNPFSRIVESGGCVPLTYRITVSAVSPYGAVCLPSSPVDASTATPPCLSPVRNLVAVAGDERATLTWNPPENLSGKQIIGYKIGGQKNNQFWLPPGYTNLQEVTVNSNVNTYTYTGLTNLGLCVFFVTPIVTPGPQNVRAATASATPQPSQVPGAVTELAILENIRDYVAFEWNPSAGGGVAEQYVLQLVAESGSVICSKTQTPYENGRNAGKLENLFRNGATADNCRFETNCKIRVYANNIAGNGPVTELNCRLTTS